MQNDTDFLRLAPPIDGFDWKKHCSQLFGVDKETYFNKFNIPGHNAVDIVYESEKRGFGTIIRAAHDGIVDRLNYDVPTRTNGNGIYLVTMDGKYSTNYWHIATFLKNIGDRVKQGDAIGTMGNTGFVRPEPTSLCPYCGTHCHFGLLEHSKKGNEYGGFIDPTPHLYRPGDRLPLRFYRDLHVGMSGDDVSWLQTCLKIEFKDLPFEPIGYFGMQTLAAVKRYQERYNINPLFGYVGEKTRYSLNAKYSIAGI